MSKTLVMIFLALFLAVGCMPEPDADDNGDASWAQQAIPELLGRKIRGWEETDVLTQAVELLGRSDVSQAMMAHDEFRVYWSEVLMDDVQIQRPGAYSGSRKAETDCWLEPMAEADGGDLARWIRKHNPNGSVATGPWGPGSKPDSFNMVDVVRSSIELDDLGPVYLTNLIPFIMSEGYNNNAEERLGTEFDEVYLGRNQSCMGCHNEAYSLSDNHPVAWKKTFQPFPEFEAKVLGDAGFGTEATLAATHAVFQPAIRDGVLYPWDLDPSCVQGRDNRGEMTDGLKPFLSSGEGDPATLASIVGTGKHILDVEEALRNGIRSLSGTTLNSFVGDGSDTDLTPDEGLAYMLALNIANNVWEEVMGERLTVVHGYSRNAEQRDMLRFLTEDQLLAEGWSLKSMLEAILTSDWFNRAAPYAANEAVNASPYHLPMLLDPWLAQPPGEATEPIEEFNGQGRVVHRYAPRSLVRSAFSAMGHSTLPPHFVSASGSERDFAINLGQYMNDSRPGTRSVDFQGIMAWSERYGTCSAPAFGESDWIDRLVSAASTWDAEHPAEAPLTLEDVVLTMKDWLIAEATLDQEFDDNMETEALEAIFGFDLETEIGAVGSVPLEEGARQYCGSLISSPHFMLAGIRPAELGSGSRLRVCNPGQPCTWEETCEAWLPLLEEASGENLQCSPLSQTLRRPLVIVLPTPVGPDLPTIPPTDFTPILPSAPVERPPLVPTVPTLPDRPIGPSPAPIEKPARTVGTTAQMEVRFAG